MEYIIIALFVLYGIREYFLFKERRDMMDRLMSKNLVEYKDNAKPEDNELEVEETNEIPIDAAKEIIYGEEEG